MKRELTLTDIAGYLPYGLKVMYKNAPKYGVFDSEVGKRRSSGGLSYYVEENEIPILRPTSDLYREITDKDYNGGKPFVPIMELAKIAGLSKLEVVEEECDHTFSVGVSQYMCDDYVAYDFKWSDDRCSFVLTEEDSNNAIEEYGNYRLFDLLHQLKFDYRGLIDAGLAVSIHDLKQNPYE